MEVKVKDSWVRKHRRYAEGEKNMYDSMLAHRIDCSPVFNPFQRRKDGFEGGLNRNTINAYQKVLEEGIWELESDIKRIANDRENYRQGLINDGYHDFEKRTKKRFDDGRDNTPGREKYLLEARLDAMKIEMEGVKELRKTFEESEQYRRHTPLKNGCQGARRKIYPGYQDLDKRVGELLTYVEGNKEIEYALMIDYQICTVINGVVCIDDAKSRFDGMAVADYSKHVCTKYRSELARRKKEFRDKVEAGELREEQVPRLQKGQIPKWPEGIKNFKA